MSNSGTGPVVELSIEQLFSYFSLQLTTQDQAVIEVSIDPKDVL